MPSWQQFLLVCFCCAVCPCCSRQRLQNRDKDINAPLEPVYRVAKRVYASPSRANFQSDFRSKVCVFGYQCQVLMPCVNCLNSVVLKCLTTCLIISKPPIWSIYVISFFKLLQKSSEPRCVSSVLDMLLPHNCLELFLGFWTLDVLYVLT
jgi:hypothetical protein